MYWQYNHYAPASWVDNMLAQIFRLLNENKCQQRASCIRVHWEVPLGTWLQWVLHRVPPVWNQWAEIGGPLHTTPLWDRKSGTLLAAHSWVFSLLQASCLLLALLQPMHDFLPRMLMRKLFSPHFLLELILHCSILGTNFREADHIPRCLESSLGSSRAEALKGCSVQG